MGHLHCAELMALGGDSNQGAPAACSKSHTKAKARTCFVYGTLMSPDVLSYILPGTSFNFTSAQLHGYRRYRLKNRRYPGVLPDTSGDSSSVNGMLVTGLSEDDLVKLHDYEGDEYEYREIEVIAANGEIIRTSCYVWRAELEEEVLKDEKDWDFSEYSFADPKHWVD